MISRLKTHAPCPICNKKVLIVNINSHLDNGECQPSSQEDCLFPSDENVFNENSSKTDSARSSSESSPPKKRLKEEEKTTHDERVKPYYLANWETILRGVLEECSDDARLFTAKERSISTETFQSLSFNAQKLYVRLFQRKWTWISINKISYPEIDEIHSTLNELKDNGFINDHSQLKDISTLINLLPSPEVKKLCKCFNVDKSTKKDIITAFDKLIKQKSFFNKSGVNEVLRNKILKKALSSLDPCFILADEPRCIFNRILSLHSLTRFYDDRDNNNAGNSNMTMMLLTNRGDLIFPIYEIQRKVPIFRSREGLLAFETALQFESQLTELSENKNFQEICTKIYPCIMEYFKTEILKNFSEEDSKIPDFLRKFTAGGIIVYCLSKCAEAFEKIRDYETAISVYKYCLSKEQIYNKELHLGHWYERLTLDLEQWLKRREEALVFIQEALNSIYVSPARKLTLCQRIVKMRKHLKDTELKNENIPGWICPESCEKSLERIEIQGAMVDKDMYENRSNSKSIFIFDSADQGKLYCSVEEFTIQYFREQYPLGVHGEGSVVNSIVFLLFWDVIYDNAVPDAFRGPYQSSPLDISSFGFYKSREDLINSRMDFIANQPFEESIALLKKNWENGEGTSSLVNWDLFSDVSQLEGLIQCFTPKQLCLLSHRLLSRHRFFRSGFPDLTLWNPHKRSLRFVEVKGPGDKLSTKQILWLNFLCEIGIDAVVCHVQAIGSKDLR